MSVALTRANKLNAWSRVCENKGRYTIVSPVSTAAPRHSDVKTKISCLDVWMPMCSGTNIDESSQGS